VIANEYHAGLHAGDQAGSFNATNNDCRAFPIEAGVLAPQVDRPLVATDASLAHNFALWSARWLCKATHAEVQVLCVLPITLQIGSAYGMMPLAPAKYDCNVTQSSGRSRKNGQRDRQ
jgi:hypothetical protein